MTVAAADLLRRHPAAADVAEKCRCLFPDPLVSEGSGRCAGRAGEDGRVPPPGPREAAEHGLIGIEHAPPIEPRGEGALPGLSVIYVPRVPFW